MARLPAIASTALAAELFVPGSRDERIRVHSPG